MPVIDPNKPRPLCRICKTAPVAKNGNKYKGKEYWSLNCSSCKGKRSAEERFWSKVDKSGDCWEWTGTLARGYGQFGIATNVSMPAHKWIFEHINGPTDLFVCHKCDNPKCVNPDHLFLGTNKDNIIDCVSKDRHCRGERSPNAKLTDEKVRKMRERHKNGASVLSIARQYGVSPNTAKRAISGTGWKHI